MEGVKSRPTLEKVAILLQYLGEDTAARVMKHIPMADVHKMTQTIMRMRPPTVEEVHQILDEFFNLFNQGGNLLQLGEDFAQKVISRAFGKDTASRMWEALQTADEQKTFEALNQMDPKVICEFTKSEHPQTIAMILAHLEPAMAGGVLSQLPEVTQNEVILRLARLKKVSGPILKEISEILQTEVLNLGVGGEEIGGLKKAAAILNHTDRAVESQIMSNIQQEDAALADGIQSLMFVFDDLTKLEDRAIQEILREVDGKLLAKALRGANEDLQNKIFRNMSSRAGEVLQEEMESMGPTRLSEVEQAQMEILKTTLRLRDEERIVISTAGEEDILV
jgi:flagellar motor switch protein FliG